MERRRISMTTSSHVFFVLMVSFVSTHAFLLRLQDRSAHAFLSAVVQDDEQNPGRIRGDLLRNATGIRPSLHPVTINALATVLNIRAKNPPELPLRAGEGGNERLQVALSAGKIAAEAIVNRRATSNADGMKLTPLEEQTVAGRVVGVTMRLDWLERSLHEKCLQAPWISKYNEWGSFGVIVDESDDKEVNDRILLDPLFRMSRAECVLALYLQYVEKPELHRKNVTVPGGSKVDFLDADRRGVLLES